MSSVKYLAAAAFGVLVLNLASADSGAKLPQLTFNNQSRHSIFVWATDVKNVELLPHATGRPAFLLEVAANSVGKLQFKPTVWNDNTKLILRFCTSPSQSCVENVGEYSGLTLEPYTKKKWYVKRVWNEVIKPYRVTDNVVELAGQAWRYQDDFPTTIVFKNGEKISRKR